MYTFLLDQETGSTSPGRPTRPSSPTIQAKRSRRATKSEWVVALPDSNDTWAGVAADGFTKRAKDEARGQEKRRITLLDLKRLFELWVKHYDKIPEEQRRLLPLRPIYFIAPTPS